MRKLIAGMKVSVDARMESAEGMADWVEAWSEDYGLMPQIDACVLGSGMYGGYERYWTGIQNEPNTPAWITGTPPTPAEVEWAGFIKKTPHFVVSNTVKEVQWLKTKFLTKLDDVAALKRQAGKDIYLIGGARLTASLIDAGLVDEIRLIVHPLIAGPGKSLFATTERRRTLDLRNVEQLKGGLLRLTYGIAA
jgi:dihydrofolate reductase